MTSYPTDEEPTSGYYEITLGFFWEDDRREGPDYVTLNFELTPSMEEDYSEFSRYEEEQDSFEAAEKARAEWVQHHLSVLLERGLVTDAFQNDYVESVSDLRDEYDNMNFRAYYR